MSKQIITEAEIRTRLKTPKSKRKNLFTEAEMFFMCRKKEEDWKDDKLSFEVRDYVIDHPPVKSRMKPDDFSTDDDYYKHLSNLLAVKTAIRDKIDKALRNEPKEKEEKKPFERLLLSIVSYKRIADGYCVTLDNDMRIKVWSRKEVVPEPNEGEDVILTINDDWYKPIYWSNCHFKSFDSRINISADMIGYKQYLKKRFGI